MTQTKIKRTITLPDTSYQQIKEYCDENGLKIARFAEKTLLYYVEQQKNKVYEQK